MVPNLVFDMTSLLVPFCAGCLGFSLVGLGALVTVALSGRSKSRPFLRVERAGANVAETSAHPEAQPRVAA